MLRRPAGASDLSRKGTPEPLADPAELSSCGAAGAIRRGELRAREYVEALIHRAEAQQHLGAFVFMDPDRLRRGADRVDRRRAAGEDPGPLAGVPLAVKDNIDVAGFPTTAGTPALRDSRPRRSAPIVRALVRAGALTMGKANMHELAYGLTTNNAFFGPARNPADPARSPGGSSGGTAVAVAAGMCPAGLGTDTAGSVRVPAALCGIVGFRPTTGRYPRGGIVPLSRTRDTPGFLARRVRDVALLDGVVTGGTAPAPARLTGVRVGVPRGHYYESLHPEVATKIEAALDRLEALGAVLVEVVPPGGLERGAEIARTLMARELPRDLASRLARTHSGLTFEELLARISSPDVRSGIASLLEGGGPGDREYRDARRQRAALRAAFARVFADHGLRALAFPATPLPAPPVGADRVVEHLGGQVPIRALARNTAPGALVALPGLTVPAGTSAAGLPVGLELDGPPAADRDLLGLGLAWEEASPESVP